MNIELNFGHPALDMQDPSNNIMEGIIIKKRIIMKSLHKVLPQKNKNSSKNMKNRQADIIVGVEAVVEVIEDIVDIRIIKKKVYFH